MTGMAMTQAAAGLALALGVALLVIRRVTAACWLCAAQTALQGAAAAAQGDRAAAALAVLEAAALVWLPRVVKEHTGLRAPASPMVLAAAAILAALGIATPSVGLPFAIALLGLLTLATAKTVRRPHHPLPLWKEAGGRGHTEETSGATQAARSPCSSPVRGGRDAVPGVAAWQPLFGLVAAQNGLAFAVLGVGLHGGALALAVLPVLPALTFAALWLGAEPWRTRRLRAPLLVARADAALGVVALMLACTLPLALGWHAAGLRLDALGIQAVILLAVLTAAAGWAERGVRPIWGARLALLVGSAWAVAAEGPLPAWPGLAVAIVAAAAQALPSRGDAWRRWCLGATGLALALLGAVAMHAAPIGLAAAGMALAGYGSVAVLAPELTIAAAVLILRLRTPQIVPLLLATGLLGLLLAGCALALTFQSPRRRVALAGLAQAAAAVCAAGLGTPDGTFAAVLQLSLLALALAGTRLATADGLDRTAALAGLAGVAPTGVFAGLALVILAAAGTPLLLLPLGAGLAMVAWALLRVLPEHRVPCLSLAWLPLALAIGLSFAMPAPLLAWFRLAAR